MSDCQQPWTSVKAQLDALHAHIHTLIQQNEKMIELLKIIAKVKP